MSVAPRVTLSDLARDGGNDRLSQHVEPLPYMKTADWKALVKTGAAPSSVILTKDRTLDDIRTVKGVDGGMRVVISTSDQDRSRDTITQAGWELRNYSRNSVVLFCHDYWSMPIAKAPRTFVEGAQLVSYPEFPTADLDPRGEFVGRMVTAGFLNAASVGFRPQKWAFNEDTGGVDFSEMELLEWSFVPVPDNPEAVVSGKSAMHEALSKAAAAGFDMAPMAAWVKDAASWLATSGLLSSQEEREAALKTLDRGRTSITVKLDANEVAVPVATLFNDLADRIAVDAATAQVPQVLIFPKAHWATAEECKAWAEGKGHQVGATDEAEDAYRIRVRSIQDFEQLEAWGVEPAGADPSSPDCKVAALGGTVKATAAQELKAGRVLSRKNQDDLTAAADSIEAGVSNLRAVLARAADYGDDDEHDPLCAVDGCDHPDHGKSAEAPGEVPAPVVVPDPPDPGKEVVTDLVALRAILAAVIPQALRELAEEDSAKSAGRLPDR